MFRFDNPDALLVLLMTAAAYATVRAVEQAAWRWLVLAGGADRLRLPHQDAAGPARRARASRPRTWSRRRPRCGRAAPALLAGSARPWSSRPAGGSPWSSSGRPGPARTSAGRTTTASCELTFGYNGVGRLTGIEQQRQRQRRDRAASRPAQTGLTRLFGSRDGHPDQLAAPGGADRVGRARVADAGDGRARIGCGPACSSGVAGCSSPAVVLSFASGIIHPYYTVALAPAIAALVGHRRRVSCGSDAATRSLAACCAVVVAAGAAWSFVLLGRADWHPGLRWVVAAARRGASWPSLLPGRCGAEV